MQWFVFYRGAQELAAVTLRGTFPGEILATIDLLAYEHGISEDSIRVAIEDRPLKVAK